MIIFYQKKKFNLIFPIFSSSYIKLNYLSNPNNLISLSVTSHSPLPLHSYLFYIWVGILVYIYIYIYCLSINWIYLFFLSFFLSFFFFNNWIRILVHIYFVYQLRWQVGYIFFAHFNKNSIKKSCPTHGFNLTQPDPCGLGWTPTMGWVGLDFL